MLILFVFFIIRAEILGGFVKYQCNNQGIRRLFVYQSSIAFFILVVITCISNFTAILSVFLAAVIAILPNMYFAKRLFQHQGAKAAKKIVSDFYRGEALKIGLSILLFAFTFACFTLNNVVFFSSYIAIYMIFWFAPIIVNH